MVSLFKQGGIADSEHHAEDEEHRNRHCNAGGGPENDAARRGFAREVAGIVAAVIQEPKTHHGHRKNDAADKSGEAAARRG